MPHELTPALHLLPANVGRRRLWAQAQNRHKPVDKTAGSLTPNDCYDAIVAGTDDTRAADKFKEAVANFEAGRYASTEVSITSEKIKEATELIRSIEKNCRK